MLTTIKVCTFFACVVVANSSCADRMNPSDVRPRAIELLAKANAAKTNPLAADESRRLEEMILDEFLVGAPKEEADDFRTMNARAGYGVFTKAPDAPDTEEVRTKWALIQAFQELRAARVAAEHLAKNPPFDSTGKTRVQIVFLKELSDPTAEAMIYRRPDDGGYPFLLVREDSLNAPDLFRMVRFAARRATLAKAVGAEEWTSVKRSQIEAIHDGQMTEGYQRIVDEFQALGIRTIPGLGKVRTVGMWTSTPETPNNN